MARILIIDDQDRYFRLCERAIPEHEYLGPVRSWAEAQEALRGRRRAPELVLLDVHFDIPADQLLGLGADPEPAAVERARRTQGLHILERLRQGHPDLPVILMTARDDLPLEQAADRLSVEEYTYFLDDDYVDANALRAQIEGILRARRGLEREGPIFWGRSMEMRRLRAQLLTLARGRLPVILAGPTGSGKSLIARHFVHARSGRKGSFVAVDLSTLPRDLMSAHLFGSVRGAYTGSVSDRRGAFEEADGGTLFLDEVGNLSEDAQKMLLTVLQEGVVTRIGDVKERKVDVKLVAATHEDLPAMVQEGRFRADLFMRLNPACMVSLPPMAERLADLPRLLEFCCEAALAGPYLRELVDEYQARFGLEGSTLRLASGAVPEAEAGTIWLLLSRKAMALLRKHPWPGNLRELAMTVENALIFTFAELAQLSGSEAAARADVVQIRPKLIRDLLRTTRVDAEAEELGGFRLPVSVRPAETLNAVSSDVERQYFTALYLAHEGDFEAMGLALLGAPDCGRKVQLRLNQLGLKVRELKNRL
ncbi:MAG: sigma-54-dependent Fis family transcriptional regulator [Alphaproteobacteria bacterium]|nr:sigma-54-dependent Fis family transcriptional regulator [Alphaproteobacteria bacterium]